MIDPRLQQILEKEIKRQNETIDLIASENFSSTAVRGLVGSVLMHKYSEGYPGKRYYEGNENIDKLELLAIDLAKQVFNLPVNWGANVQPLAGSNANLAVYNAVLNPGDKILSMFLPDGGHLSHGWSYNPNSEAQINDKAYYGGEKKVSFVSKIYNVVQYKTDPATGLLDYDFIEKLAIKEKPRLIITGGTAYPRNIDYVKLKEIATKVGALYMADVAHEAGLIAGGVLNSPVGIADIVTMTTHKTLRGPKGAVILASNDLIQKINYSVMPGLQGGAHNGTIAGIAQALFEAQSPDFKRYSEQILRNAKTLAKSLLEFEFKLVSGGTDKHFVLVDLRPKKLKGKDFAKLLNSIGIVTNMNSIPYDMAPPANPSGLRLGTPSITTRGFSENEVKMVAEFINRAGSANITEKVLEEIKNDVKQLVLKFPFNL